MASMFVFMSNRVVSNQFRQYAVAAQQGSATAWGNQLILYYETHGQSWVGLQNFLVYILQFSNHKSIPEYMEVLSGSGAPVATLAVSNNNLANANADINLPLKVNNQKIGTLIIRNRGIEQLFQIERSVIRSIMLVTIAGTLLTAILALGVAVWFSNRLTDPLKKLLQGIEGLAEGNLETQVEAVSTDELGAVASAFNNLVGQLKRTEQARKHLVADVAHELRTPLSIINGQLELIEQGIKASDIENLLPIHDEVFRLTQLVNDLHQLTIAEAGKLVLNKQLVDMPSLVERIVENFQMATEDNGVSVKFETDVDELSIPVDRNRLTQVLINLIGNAVRYTPEGGTVEVIVARKDEYAEIKVKDTGVGIAPDHQAHIFDRFYRADEDRTRDTGGTGLGLAIAKEFVEAHGGNIELSSTVGVGSAFTVHLPLPKSNMKGA